MEVSLFCGVLSSTPFCLFASLPFAFFAFVLPFSCRYDFDEVGRNDPMGTAVLSLHARDLDAHLVIARDLPVMVGDLDGLALDLHAFALDRPVAVRR
jgi:hypothetical protein